MALNKPRLCGKTTPAKTRQAKTPSAKVNSPDAFDGRANPRAEPPEPPTRDFDGPGRVILTD